MSEGLVAQAFVSGVETQNIRRHQGEKTPCGEGWLL